MAQGKGVEMDVVEAADAYFKKFEIKSLLTQILIKLGEEQPEDPAQAIRAHLEVSELRAGTGGAVVQPVALAQLDKMWYSLRSKTEHLPACIHATKIHVVPAT